MIVITTPRGQIGSQVVARLLDSNEAVRIITRFPADLATGVRERVEVVEGSHQDPDVLDRALSGASAVFWLLPPDPRAPSAEAGYLAFARAGADAIRRHAVGHVVGVSSAGHGWPKPAGLLSAAFVMDAELERSGASYRALSMPIYMENLLPQVDALREHGAFSLTYQADRPIPMVATRDIAQAAAELLSVRSWSGQENVPVFGPDRLSPLAMADVMSEVLGRPVAYHQTSIEDFTAQMSEWGANDQTVREMTEMLVAQDEGLYEADWKAAILTSTDFRTWCQQVLRPATNAQGA